MRLGSLFYIFLINAGDSNYGLESPARFLQNLDIINIELLVPSFVHNFQLCTKEGTNKITGGVT